MRWSEGAGGPVCLWTLFGYSGIRVTGFEPATSATQRPRSTKLSYTLRCGAGVARYPALGRICDGAGAGRAVKGGGWFGGLVVGEAGSGFFEGFEGVGGVLAGLLVVGGGLRVVEGFEQ